MPPVEIYGSLCYSVPPAKMKVQRLNTRINLQYSSSTGFFTQGSPKCPRTFFLPPFIPPEWSCLFWGYLGPHHYFIVPLSCVRACACGCVSVCVCLCMCVSVSVSVSVCVCAWCLVHGYRWRPQSLVPRASCTIPQPCPPFRMFYVTFAILSVL